MRFNWLILVLLGTWTPWYLHTGWDSFNLHPKFDYHNFR